MSRYEGVRSAFCAAVALSEKALFEWIFGLARIGCGQLFRFAAVTDTNWQPVIQDKACELPPEGEDYAGAVCTGTVVELNRSADLASIGEDYHGFEPAAPEGSLMTIVLKPRLTQKDRGQAIGGD